MKVRSSWPSHVISELKLFTALIPVICDFLVSNAMDGDVLSETGDRARE
jgi:hypothetical protein